MIETVSEILIQTLKQFSVEKRTLNVASLCDALSGNKEFLSLLPNQRPNGPSSRQEQILAAPEDISRPGPLKRAEALSDPTLSKIRENYLEILTGLGPLSTGENDQRFSELKVKLAKCKSVESLVTAGEDLVELVKCLTGYALERIDYASDYLFELSKDLSGMEKQLLSYQTHHRETFRRNDEFRNNLQSHTADMNQTFDSNLGFEETRSIISSKLSSIGKAIEVKRKEDEARLREANTKIAELQNNISIYGQEILQVKERANTLEKEVLLDALTEVHNRRAYELQIRDCFRQFHRDKKTFSLVLFDVDRFKNVNDQFGHQAGDKCLKEIARLIKGALRKTDFLARYGGEEFIAILIDSSFEDATRIAQKVRTRIDIAQFSFQTELIPVTVSVGVTEISPGDKESEAPFLRADEALYRAKKEGRNRVCALRDLAPGI